jgi:phenylacetate-CoA ligase
MTDTRTYYDDLETRDPEARARDQAAALSAQIAHAKANSAYFGEILKDVDPPAINSRQALAALPVTRKSDLAERQKLSPPLGGLNGVDLGALTHIFQSPGPIYEPGGDIKDFFRFARCFWAVGVRPGDVVYNTFSYHLTPAGMMIETAARAIGCPVVPGGVGNTEQQLEAIAHIRPHAYAGTPSFLRILLDKAGEMGVDISSITKASVGGEYLPPDLRKAWGDRGIAVLQSYGTADLGLIAYESPALEGMIADEGVIVEIVRPGSGDPVPDGEVGEVVVTALDPVYPLIRFATGDLSAVMAGVSPCGRTNMRIKGWMGRADQTTKVRGMFVRPEQVNQVAARHAEVGKARLVIGSIDNRDTLMLRCETEAAGDALKSAVAESFQAVCKVRSEVELTAPGSLPNDGKVIDDTRTYE